MRKDQKVMSNSGDRAGSIRVHPIKTSSFSMKQPIEN